MLSYKQYKLFLTLIAISISLSMFLTGCSDEQPTGMQEPLPKSSVVPGSEVSLARIRFLNVSPESVTNSFVVDEEVVAAQIDYSYLSDYALVASGNRTLRSVSEVSGTVIGESSASLLGGLSYIFFSGSSTFGRELSFTPPLLLTEDTNLTAIPNMKVRMVNMAALLPPFDLYLSNPDAPAAPEVTLKEILYSVPSDYLETNALNYRLRIAATDGGTDLLTREEVPCYEGETCTLVLLEQTGAEDPYLVLVIPEAMLIQELDLSDPKRGSTRIAR